MTAAVCATSSVGMLRAEGFLQILASYQSKHAVDYLLCIRSTHMLRRMHCDVPQTYPPINPRIVVLFYEALLLCAIKKEPHRVPTSVIRLVSEETPQVLLKKRHGRYYRCAVLFGVK